MKPIIMIGGGGHCKSVIEAAESSGLPIAGILDLPSTVATRCLRYEIIGTDDDIPRLAETHDFVVTVGFITNPSLRIHLHELVEKAGGNFATVVASTANVSRHASLGPGTVVLHNACVNAGATVGKGCIINTLANVEHDAAVGDYTHVSTGAMINGDCRVGERCFIGSGTVICNALSVTSDCMVGAGSLVNHDIEIPGVYAGFPARKIKQ